MKSFLLSIIFAITATVGFSTTHYIYNSGTSFSPDSIIITVGDSVYFDLSSSHNAIEVSSSTWNSNGNTPLSGGFQTNYSGGLVLPSYLTIGTHYFVCSPHASMGMKGKIIVQNCTPATPGTISGNTSVCASGSYTYSISAVSGATSYTWTLPSGWSGTSSTNSINATSGSTGGNISVTANNACGSSAAKTLGVNVSSIPSTPGTISGNTTICSGSSNNYSITAVNGATSYTWTLPSGWTGTSTTNSISTVAGSTSGNITVKANNSCGSSSVKTLAVTVNTIPATPGTITGDTNICAGTTNTYSVSAVNGATSYTWTLPAGWSGISLTDSITATSGSNGGFIKVTANNTCGSSPAKTSAISVTNIPVISGLVSGDTDVCVSGSHTYSIGSVANATSYTWTLPSGWSGASVSNSISATAGNSSGNILVTANNKCGSSQAKSLSVTVHSSAPVISGTISGDTTVCDSSLNNYSIAPVNDATFYTWTLPNGWTGSSKTNTISAVVISTSGDISVTANNSCGSSAVQKLHITITGGSALPQPGVIAGDSIICQGSTKTYSIAPVNGATSYKWTLPAGWSGSSASGSIDATANATSGNITVSAVNQCGLSAVQTKYVEVISAPVLTDSISGNTVVCAATANTYSIPAVNGATSYNWILPSGWSGSSATNSINTTAGSTGGSISVTADNMCGSSAVETLTITVNTVPETPGAIEGDTAICAGSSTTYSIAEVKGASSYIWTLPSGWTGSSATKSITVSTNNSDGVISVRSENACGSSADQFLSVKINKVNTSVLQTAAELKAIDSDATYQWIDCSSQIPLSGQSGQVFKVTANGSYAVIVSKNGCSDTSSCYEINTVGISQNYSNPVVSVYPNPSNGKINISISNSQASSNFKMEIYNFQGKLVYQSNHSVSEIDLSDQPKGIYLMHIYNGQSILTEKIFVQ